MFTPYKMMFTLHTLMFTPHNILFSGNRCVVESRSEPADPRRRSHVPVDAGKEEEKDINRRFRVELHVLCYSCAFSTARQLSHTLKAMLMIFYRKLDAML